MGHLWSLFFIRGHSWSFVCSFRQDPFSPICDEYILYIRAYARYSMKNFFEEQKIVDFFNI